MPRDKQAELLRQMQQQRIERQKLCDTCNRIPFLGTDVLVPLCAEQQGGGIDFDVGVYEYIYRTSDQSDSARVDDETARRTFERCARHVRKIHSEFKKSGVLFPEKNRTDKMAAASSQPRIVAPFDLDEMQIGTLLGTGAFSAVYEIVSFREDPELTPRFNVREQEARKYLVNTAQLPVEIGDSVGSKWAEKHVGGSALRHRSASRYAIKHLRRGLVKEPERFERAAIDLVLEAQILLALSHPNIISLRGWSHQGVEGLLSGRPTGFFFIIDRLPETLEDRIFKWRAAVQKYRGRLKLPWGRQKNALKLDEVLVDRLKVARDLASAIEYMHSRLIMNRDLKTTNIGFDMRGELKLFDFGLARILPSKKELVADNYVMSRVGTKYYMAPEVRKKLPYNLSADLYSYGVCMWEILSMGSAREALTGLREEALRSHRCPLPICKCWPADVANVMADCLSVKPVHRPSITEVRYYLELWLDMLNGKLDKASLKSTVLVSLFSVDSQASREFASREFDARRPSLASRELRKSYQAKDKDGELPEGAKNARRQDDNHSQPLNHDKNATLKPCGTQASGDSRAARLADDTDDQTSDQSKKALHEGGNAGPLLNQDKACEQLRIDDNKKLALIEDEAKEEISAPEPVCYSPATAENASHVQCETAELLSASPENEPVSQDTTWRISMVGTIETEDVTSQRLNELTINLTSESNEPCEC